MHPILGAKGTVATRGTMIKLEDIHSLTDFQRNTRAHMERIRKTGRPTVLTVNGHAELVVQDAAAYQRLIEELEKARASVSSQTVRK
jgi:PHD/YefM family antitoxin component YafN of YafNO toxin-antitoxin module